jgi:serine/threonine protein kinase
MGFKLGRVLGSGKFGFVKEAVLNDKHYAMKVLKRNEEWDGNDKRMVREEIEVMKNLDHPKIIKCLCYFFSTSPSEEQEYKTFCVY